MTSTPKVIAKADAAKRYFSKLGIEYRVITENEIGLDALKAFVPSGLSHASEEYRAHYSSRRKDQKRLAQARYVKKQSANMSAEELERRRAYHRMKQQEYRARKRQASQS